MKLEPVAWIDPYATNYVVGDEAVMMSATSKKHAKFTAPLYAIPEGYVVVPVGQVKDAELALDEAVAALYFNDNSDYPAALWTIVERLGGKEAYDLLMTNAGAAYQKYCAAAKEQQ